MNKNTLKFGFLGIAALTLVSCGEEFQGTFVGNATLDGNCGPDFKKGEAVSVEVSGRLSGNDFSFTILRIIPKDQNRPEPTAHPLTAGAIDAPLGGDDESFFVENYTFQNVPAEQAVLSAQGQLSKSRDEIRVLDVNFKGVLNNTANQGQQSCNITLHGTNLRIHK